MATDNRDSAGLPSGYYNTYTTIARLPTVHGCSAVQGFAAGPTYLYSVKIGDHDRLALIYRTDKSTGATTVMANGTDNSAFNSWLGHANDMTIVDHDGVTHLFIVTMATTGAQLIKLRHDGTTYYKEGSYGIQLNGAAIGVAGISTLTQDSTTITFWFKAGRDVYSGQLPLRADSGTINVTKIFHLSVTGALVDGSPVSDLDTFVNQGFYYDQHTHILYYPLTKANRSIVLAYRNVTASSTGTLTSAADLSFRITSSAYPHNFEIESVGISDGKLYFNTNRAKSRTGPADDGVHYFNRYAGS